MIAVNTDYLLGLDDVSLAYRRALIIMAQHLAESTTLGNQSSMAKHMSTRLRNPKPGDFVWEQTSIALNREHTVYGFGRLVRFDGDTYVVQYGPNPEDVVRWRNARFLVVPVDIDAFERPRSFDAQAS